MLLPLDVDMPPASSRCHHNSHDHYGHLPSQTKPRPRSKTLKALVRCRYCLAHITWDDTHHVWVTPCTITEQDHIDDLM